MYELVDPRGTPAAPDGTLVARIPRVPGNTRIGFLVNEVSRKTGPDFYGYTEIIEAALRERFGHIDVHRDCKPVLSRPAGDELLAHFRDCSGVVSGLAK